MVGALYASLSLCFSKTAPRRGFYQYTAVRDYEANADACRLPGMSMIGTPFMIPLNFVRF